MYNSFVYIGYYFYVLLFKALNELREKVLKKRGVFGSLKRVRWKRMKRFHKKGFGNLLNVQLSGTFLKSMSVNYRINQKYVNLRRLVVTYRSSRKKRSNSCVFSKYEDRSISAWKNYVHKL